MTSQLLPAMPIATGTASEPMTASTAYAIDAVTITTFRTVKYLVQVSQGSINYQSAELLVMHNGTDTFMTEYGDIWTGTSPLGMFSAGIAAGTMTLSFTPTTTATYTVNMSKLQLTV